MRRDILSMHIGGSLLGAGRSFTLTSNVGGNPLSTRATTWGGTGTAPGDQIQAIFNVTWADEAHAKAFFDGLGEIRIRLTQGTNVTPQDTDWVTTLGTKVGTVTVFANTSTNSGSVQDSVAAGYYQFPTSSLTQKIYNGANIGGGAYASNMVFIYAQTLNRIGANGANGNGFQITVQLQDAHTGTSDVVSAGATVAVDVKRSVGSINTVVPTIGLISAF